MSGVFVFLSAAKSRNDNQGRSVCTVLCNVFVPADWEAFKFKSGLKSNKEKETREGEMRKRKSGRERERDIIRQG